MSEKNVYCIFLECGDEGRGDLHLPPLKSLILFTCRRPEEGIPGKETEEVIYERTGTVLSGQGLPKGCTLSAINLEFSIE